MNTNLRIEKTASRPCWFVGAAYGSTDDQTDRFLKEGIWETGYSHKYSDEVNSIQPGDRIAIKATYTKKHGLPFDNRNQTVSVLAIKAIGIVKENLGDGRTLKVDWEAVVPKREWYFATGPRKTVWKVIPDNWKKTALIEFTFEGADQDYDRFRNDPRWRERFGDTDGEGFQWTRFYEAIADKLLAYKDDRSKLVAGIHDIASRFDVLSYLQNDQFADGSSGPLKDICPFTAMGIFNRGITVEKRKSIARELADFLEVSEAVPDSFDGIPVLNNQNSWFFGYEKDRGSQIDDLWKVFGHATKFSQSDDEGERAEFIASYDKAISLPRVGWNLTMGFYWIRPWDFPTLDSRSQDYIEKNLDIQIATDGPGGYCGADDYLDTLDALESRFLEDDCPVHSFPELSLAAFEYSEDESGMTEEDEGETETHNIHRPDHYSIEDIISDGCFVLRDRLREMLDRFQAKRSLVLQGPPGTGKTWLAKRLAYALVGWRDNSKICAVQFHPNLSYEDFVRGWRPEGDGKLALVDGPFMEMIRAAKQDPESKYVVVIEEINRGNPAQIFGEMLTLLEADKRKPEYALQLSYKQKDSERVYVPDNLYVIGTMNVADRSLALVDYALRRRFAFIDLEPTFNELWREWLRDKCSIDLEVITKIESRMQALNKVISEDSGLGRQYRIGHSYVTPVSTVGDPHKWFRQVVDTEIGPLLDEYWFDAPGKVQDAKQLLLEGF